MAQFDYKTAWRELAAPAFDALPPAIRDLVSAVAERAASLQQAENLDVPMPAELEPAFDAIDSPALASAARIVYFFGHWGSSRDNTLTQTGAYWKFSNLADQVLSRRCGIERSRRKNNRGVSYAVHEGIIRFQVSTPDSWTWDEIAPATPENADMIRLRQAPGAPSDIRGRDDWDRWATNTREVSRAIKAEIGPWTGLLAGWDDTDRFMA